MVSGQTNSDHRLSKHLRDPGYTREKACVIYARELAYKVEVSGSKRTGALPDAAAAAAALPLCSSLRASTSEPARVGARSHDDMCRHVH